MNFLRRTFLWILLLPYALGYLGAASNQLVFIANHGKFPVEMNPAWTSHLKPRPDGMIDDRHCVMTADTHLNLLADIFNFHTDIQSVGDLLLQSGDSLTPYCWAMWLGLSLTRREPEYVPPSL
jgi:hypothetical protein